MPVVVNSGTPVGSKDEWRTPPELFNLLDHEFHFDLDVAATPQNAHCTDFYTEEDNALKQPWGYFGDYDNRKTAIFCNPPFSLTGKFLVKGRQEVAQNEIICVFLIRADAVETKWWEDGVLHSSYWVDEAVLLIPSYQIRFLKPRINFLNPIGGTAKGVTFPSAVIVMSRYHFGVYWWNWKVAAKKLNLLEK